ncbi:MAG: hypothetical protein JXJ04_07900 [Spirochaetales bacterium]|nr:hypothetical protein [Spirochaetales bacterium]
MKKKLRIILILVCMGYIPYLHGLSQTDIIHTEWGPETGYFLFGTYIKFYDDGTVLFRNKNQGGRWGVDTTFDIFDGTININFPADVHDKNSHDTCTLRYDFVADSPGVYFSKSLVLINYQVLTEYIPVYILDEIKKVWDYQSPAEPGKKITIDKNELITTGALRAFTTDDLNMRDAPSLKGRQLIIVSGMEDEGAQNFLKKNTEVLVVGKSEKKMKIQKWENYWYCIKAPVDNYGSIKYKNKDEYCNKSGLVWVYGEFLRIAEPVELPRVPEKVFDANNLR